MTDDERVRAAAEALRADRLSGSQGSWEELAEIVLEASGYPAEVARLRQLYEAEAAEVVSLNEEVARLQVVLKRQGADLDRAIDALRALVSNPSVASALSAEAVLADHDREAHDD